MDEPIAAPPPDRRELLVSDAGAVRTLTLNRPHVRNALDGRLINGLNEAIVAAAADPGVCAVVLTGAGSAFCSGLDLRAVRSPGWNFEWWNALLVTIRETPVPVIAAVNGPANTGGLGLVLSCDFAVASRAATFSDLHAKLGLVSASGIATQLLDRIGLPRAKEMWITARVLDAETAYAWGLVNDVVAGDQLLPVVAGRAAMVASFDREYIQTVIETHQTVRNAGLESAFAAERAAAARWASRTL
jgi:enoyl-CoA hydratase